MLIINIKQLQISEDEYYYQGKLFTGVGFTANEDKIDNRYVFSQGRKIGIYQNKYFPQDQNLLHIDIDSIDFAGEYLDGLSLYDNHKFSDIAYELEGEQEICLGEHFIVDGVVLVSVGWYLSGEKESLRLDNNNIVQVFEWFRDSSIRKIGIYIIEQQKMLIQINITEANKLKSVRLGENYFDLVETYKSELEFHYFETRNFFDNFDIDSSLLLIDLGVDDVLFDHIIAKCNLQYLSSITIFNTSLTESSILKLTNFDNIQKISFLEDNDNLLSTALKLKEQKPNCIIKYNHTKITNDKKSSRMD